MGNTRGNFLSTCVLALACAAALQACTLATPQEITETATPAVAVSAGKSSKKTDLRGSDRRLADRHLQAALERAMSGSPLAWRSPDGGIRGWVTPLKTWKDAGGRYCRSYRERIRLASGTALSRTGTACRTPAAVWVSA